jgi:hypothetical protein
LKPAAAIDRDAIAVNVVSLIGHEIGGEIGELAMLASAAERVGALPTLSY